jgi:hypothetical protein
VHLASCMRSRRWVHRLPFASTTTAPKPLHCVGIPCNRHPFPHCHQTSFQANSTAVGVYANTARLCSRGQNVGDAPAATRARRCWRRHERRCGGRCGAAAAPRPRSHAHRVARSLICGRSGGFAATGDHIGRGRPRSAVPQAARPRGSALRAAGMDFGRDAAHRRRGGRVRSGRRRPGARAAEGASPAAAGAPTPGLVQTAHPHPMPIPRSAR